MMMMPELEEQGIEPPFPGIRCDEGRTDIPPDHEVDDSHKGEGYGLKRGARIASIPGVGVESFARGGFTADHNAMATRNCEYGIKCFEERVKSESQVLLELIYDSKREVDGYWRILASALVRGKSRICLLGVFVMPKEGTAQGRLILDGSWEGSELGEATSDYGQRRVVIICDGRFYFCRH